MLEDQGPRRRRDVSRDLPRLPVAKAPLRPSGPPSTERSFLVHNEHERGLGAGGVVPSNLRRTLEFSCASWARLPHFVPSPGLM